LYYLALRTTERDFWTNVAGAWSEAYPGGAGLCVRREVVAEFSRGTMACGLRRLLWKQMRSFEDLDINLTACDMGLGCGVFHLLKRTHLIPACRLNADYLLKVSYGNAFSGALLFTARGKPPADPLPTRLTRLIWKARLLRQPSLQRAFSWAGLTGT